MAEVRHLKRFTITEVEDGYRLHIEDDRGQALELLADEEQLDLIIEQLDDVLGDFEDDDELNGGGPPVAS